MPFSRDAHANLRPLDRRISQHHASSANTWVGGTAPLELQSVSTTPEGHIVPFLQKPSHKIHLPWKSVLPSFTRGPWPFLAQPLICKQLLSTYFAQIIVEETHEKARKSGCSHPNLKRSIYKREEHFTELLHIRIVTALQFARETDSTEIASVWPGRGGGRRREGHLIVEVSQEP